MAPRADPRHLFVYGTLRSEFPHPLSRRLSLEARLIGKGSAPGILYAFSSYPGAVFRQDARERVIGEVYALRGERLLAELDAYEGVVETGTPAFRRVPIGIRLYRGGQIEAWTYELTEAPRHARRIEGGDFMQHLGRVAPRPVRL